MPNRREDFVILGRCEGVSVRGGPGVAEMPTAIQRDEEWFHGWFKTAQIPEKFKLCIRYLRIEYTDAETAGYLGHAEAPSAENWCDGELRGVGRPFGAKCFGGSCCRATRDPLRAPPAICNAP